MKSQDGTISMASASTSGLPDSPCTVAQISSLRASSTSSARAMIAARSAGGSAAQAGWAARARAIAAVTSSGVLTVISPTDSRVAGLARPSRRWPSEVGDKACTMAMTILLRPVTGFGTRSSFSNVTHARSPREIAAPSAITIHGDGHPVHQACPVLRRHGPFGIMVGAGSGGFILCHGAAVAVQLGDAEGQVQRLAAVEPGVARRLVAVAQVAFGNVVAAADAFGDIIAGELDVDAARMGTERAVHLEEADDLVQ